MLGLMSGEARRYFTDEDLEAVRAQVTSSELRTAGEIVPYLVERVGEHPEIRPKGALLMGLLSAVLSGAWLEFAAPWGATPTAGWSWSGGVDFFWSTVPLLLGVVIGWWLPSIPAVGRLLVDPAALDRRVQLRAEAAFLEEEVFRTDDRTGILVFLALWEHRAVILADEGIHRAVPEGAWQELVDDLVAGIASGRAADALIEVIRRCGELLERYGVERQADDEDELADAARLRER